VEVRMATWVVVRVNHREVRSSVNQGDEAIVSDGARIVEAEPGGRVAVVSGDVIAKKQRLRESVKWPQQLEQLQQLVEVLVS